MGTQGQAATVDIILNGQGQVVVTVRDTAEVLVPGAVVNEQYKDAWASPLRLGKTQNLFASHVGNPKRMLREVRHDGCIRR